jgi:acetamidase/formamidase
MTLHELEPERENVHFDFCREREPVLWVDSGDTVVVRTLDAAGFLSGPGGGPNRPRMNPDAQGHALCGPIGVRGAKPGQTLEVELREITPDTWGFTGAGGRSKIAEAFRVADDNPLYVDWDIDPDAMIATAKGGFRVRLAPFMGVMGMPPAEEGSHPTAPPRHCGGNLDCRELTAGTSLFLPITTPNALFSIGDGHAAQGDGEVSTMAIECPMQRVEFVLRLYDAPALTMPRARTKDAWITFGVAGDLDEAVFIATNEMLDLMEHRLEIGRKEALILASVVVDVRITQIVNGIVGAHAILRDDAIGG